MPRRRVRPLFEIGNYWIAREPKRPGLYRYWKDPKSGRTRRASVGTENLERAKEDLLEFLKSGEQPAANDLVSDVLEKYFEERTDGKPSEKQSRNAGRVLLTCWGGRVRARHLDEAKQREFADWCVSRDFRLSYVARNLGVLASAIRHAGVTSPRIIVNENTMRDRWNISDLPPKRRYIPTDKELARLLSAPMPERLFRWIVIQMATGGRPQTAVDLEPSMRNKAAKTVSLNPEHRRQNKKYRATVREGQALSGWLNKWEEDGLDAYGGRYCGYATVEGVKTALQALRDRKGVALPHITTYSFRHKVASVLRMARVPEDQVALMLGHRRPDLRTTAGYGEWDPSYLKEASAAIDDWFRRVQRLTSREIITPRNSHKRNAPKLGRQHSA